MFSDYEIDLIYGVVHALYQQGKIESAFLILQVLLIYRPVDKKIVEAFSICCKKLGKYEDASLGFIVLLAQYPEDLKFAQHLAECMAARGLDKQALEAVEAIISAISKAPDEYNLIFSRAKFLRSMLVNKQDELSKNLQ